MNRRFQQSSATIWFGVMGVVVIVILGACSTYRAQPLSDEAVNTALTPPTWPELQVRVTDLRHARLPTQSINPAGPFSPEQLALVAVVANPGLRAIRAEQPSERCLQPKATTPSTSSPSSKRRGPAR